MIDTSDFDRRIELERSDAARKALEEAANALEILHGADQYQRAWRKAADFLRKFRFSEQAARWQNLLNSSNDTGADA